MSKFDSIARSLTFKDIAFGYSSAEAERTNDPGLLLEGHIDFKAASDEALYGSKYLFLGYKGAGKSSIAERIALTQPGGSLFVRSLSLAEFPFTPFSKVVRGDAEPESKFPTAWSWIILIYVLESMARDTDIRPADVGVFQDAVRAFREMGLSPAAEPAAIVRTSSKNNFKLSLPGKMAEFSWSGSETKPASDIPDFVESLKELIRGVRGDNMHYLLIDGLDDVLTTREIQYKSLAALIFEIGRLNLDFRKNKVPVKIVLLCRTDLYERIPGANKNKIRQDHAVELDWYHDPREPKQSALLEIANLRAFRSLKTRIDLFDTFFPVKIDTTEIRRYLLEMTRHTPRDFVRLLFHLQDFSGSGRLPEGAIKSGLRDYSIKYFLPEIQDELSGYANPEEISRIISALGRLRKRDFRLEELIHTSTSSSRPLSAERIYEIVQALFNCSDSEISNTAKEELRSTRSGIETDTPLSTKARASCFIEDSGNL
jgi:hypothetical protein